MSVVAAKVAKRAAPVRAASVEADPAGVLAGLRAAVARIEGTPQRFAEETSQRFIEETPRRFVEETPQRRREDATAAAGRQRSDVLSLGFPALDAALGGGWPRAGLAELHGDDTQGVGAATGLALALASRFEARPGRPLVWIATRLAFREAGRLHGPGLLDVGLDPRALVCVGADRLAEALWAAEETARAGSAALAVVEVRGNPAMLGLQGTRRLQLRAGAGGAPLVLLRQGGRAEATAAPLRLRVAADRSPSPCAGIPAFRLAVEKARRAAPSQEIVVGWNVHERRFESPRPFEPPRPDAFPLPAQACDRQDPPAGSGAGLALGRYAS